MGDRSWTSSQKNAINLRNGTVLVSAAAGSGKTAVLVQRIIEGITDNKKPCSADRLLVATFTNAAASEMRERISLEIARMIDGNPENAYLRKQQILLKRAKISTIDSFCNDIVRENFYRLGISPNFRISDDNETLILRENAIDNVMDRLYEEGSKEFLNLVELFSKDRDDVNLVRIIEQLYNFMRAYPFPDEWMSNIVSLYEEVDNVCDTVWGEVMVNYLEDTLDYLIELTNISIELCRQDKKIEDAYLEVLKSDMVNLSVVMRAAEAKSWNGIVKALQFEFDKQKKQLRGYNDDIVKIKIVNNRKYVKDVVKKLKSYFCMYEDKVKQDNKKIKDIVTELFYIVKLFDDEFQKIKSERNVADFGDLEYWMIKLLVKKKNGYYEKSQVAIELSEQFDEIMIDECQDINETQSMIFKMLSKDEKNLFMVGDVKQSIYGFRQAMPEIFLKRKEAYSEYYAKEEKYPLKVILDKNFRSRRGVLDTVNFIFKQLMSKNLGDMDYTEEEKLKYGSNYPESNDEETEIHIIETQKDEEKSKNTIEAKEIAKIISKMISEGKLIHDSQGSHRVTYRDFCILLRSANKHAADYAKELYNCGIPVWCDANGKFFGTVEISVMISLLRIIDNPIQDIPLISVLVSPIYGFTPDDLARLRINDRNIPIYFALKQFKENGDKRCKKFLDDLDEYRRLSVMLRPNKLINYIYDKTGYLAIVQAMENGELRLANLRMLVEYAGKYEGDTYKGLSGFIRFIDKLQEQKSDLTPASSISETANVVRIMSIHRSKGLEFPICILAGCSRNFNSNREEVMVHNKLGLGIKLRNSNNTLHYPTVIRQAISLELKRDGLSEELRVLYVALTRAREKLIIIMTVDNLESKVNKIMLGNEERISPYLLRSMNSFGDWILCAMLRHPSAKKLVGSMGMDGCLVIMNDVSDWKIKLVGSFAHEHNIENIKDEETPKINNDILKLVTNRFDYLYPYQDLKNVPVKVAASQISHGDMWSKYIATSKPSFLLKSSLTGAESGTAIHQFLQFADYKNSVQDFDVEILRLLDKGFLSEEQIKVINKKQILKFLNSELGKRILSSDDLKREYRFSVRVPIEEYDKRFVDINANDNIVLQGAIDCVFEENGEYIIVDYKTDIVNESKQLVEKYRNQLEIYKYAFEKCNGCKVKECIIYSFTLGKQEVL